jgi:pimeloyl-ACP methyl ester carboxylesterase
LLASLVPIAMYRPWIDAQTAAFVVLSTTIDTPVLNWIARASTDKPRAEEVRVAGQEATVVRPGTGKHWPGIVFVNGATEEGHLHPEVQRLARGLARAHFLVVVPELPGLRRGEITLRTLSALVAVARATAQRPDVETGRVGFVGVSVGSSLALAAAEDETLAGRVSAIAGIAPYVDLKEVARLATTGYIRTDTRLAGYNPDDFVLLAVARSFAASLPSARDRGRFETSLARIPNERDDPLAGFTLPAGASRGGRALFELLANGDPLAFDRLWRRLPRSVRDAAERLSPISRPGRLTMPVELATSPRDDYFPVTESRRLARASQHVRVTVTESLSHALPEPSFHGLGAAFHFDGFVVRSLRALGHIRSGASTPIRSRQRAITFCVPRQIPRRNASVSEPTTRCSW